MRGDTERIHQASWDRTDNTLNILMNADTATWSLYIIEASDASLYTGIATDVERRFEEHLGCQKGAKYFNGRSPVRVVYREDGHTRSSASKRETEIKKLSRREKQNLIESQQQTVAL